jgi:hypothetical protein
MKLGMHLTTENTKMKTCLWCNEDFRPNRYWQDFCCTQHQQAWWRHWRKRGDVMAADARVRARRGIVDSHVARVDEAVQAQSAEPMRRRL